MSTREELQLLLRAARLYYEDDLTQQEVAKELGVSRPTVSRLLAQARQEGIVQITVADPFASHEELESRLSEAFSLRQAVVVTGEGATEERLGRRLGRGAARYLRTTLNNGELVGVGWGRTLHAVAEALDVERQVGIQVFPLIGGLEQISSSFQVNELARRLADAFGGAWRPLYAPAFVADATARRALFQIPDVAAIIQSWPNLGMALTGIGHFAMHRQSSMLFANYMDGALLAELERQGAVGDLCGRFFDAQGRQCLDEPGVIGISLEQLKRLDCVVGVAGGQDKAAAILGALRGGYLNVLVTDTLAAQAILKAHESDG
jgi:DNA-binding transcriptional regulator LsrR (DeoR family)